MPNIGQPGLTRLEPLNKYGYYTDHGIFTADHLARLRVAADRLQKEGQAEYRYAHQDYYPNIIEFDDAFAEVLVRQPSYLPVMSQALTEVPLEDWKVWLSFQLVRGAAPYLSSAFVDESFDFWSRTLTGAEELRARWKRAVALCDGALGEAVGEQYVARHFPPTAKVEMDELVANLVEAYRVTITDLEWMSPETREQALVKLDQFRPKVGYPDAWRDYSALTIERDDLVGNVRRPPRSRRTVS